jgi:hypothetical protein
MVLRDKNIDFLKAKLFEDEAAGDNAENNNEMEAGPCASTNYAKRKRKEEYMIFLITFFCRPRENVLGSDNYSWRCPVTYSRLDLKNITYCGKEYISFLYLKIDSF